MKRFFLLSAIIATHFAAFAQNAETGSPYVKAHIGLQKGQSVTSEPGQFKSNLNVVGIVGLGYNLADNIRSDVSLERYFNWKYTGPQPLEAITARFKTDIMMLNFYMDVAEFKGYKMFLGMGAGTSNVNAHIKIRDPITNQLQGEIRYKQHDIFTYGFYAGTHYEFTPGSHAELMYSFKDLGLVVDSVKLKLHNITAGIRFDL